MKASFIKIFITLLLCLTMFTVTVFAAPDDPAATTTPETPGDDPTDEEEVFQVIRLQSAGGEVARVQIRLSELGYLCYRATGQFGQMSRDAVIAFQTNNSLTIDGTIGETSFNKLFENGLVRAKIAPNLTNTSGPAAKGKPAAYGEAGDWFEDVLPSLKSGDIIEITDLNSNIQFDMKFLGGQNHGEVTPKSDTDKTNFEKAFGGKRNFEKRAVLAKIKDVVYAGSLFGWLHGEQNAQTCLYFTGSLSHVLDLPDEEHAEMVKRAAGK